MRDGTRLFTAIYTPKDSSKKYAVLLNRTPYSLAPYGESNFPSALRPSENFAREGYIL
jgi:predicted acyl esterase